MKTVLISFLSILVYGQYRELQQNEAQPFQFLSQVPSFQAASPTRRKFQQKEIPRPIPGEKELDKVNEEENVDEMDEDFQEFVE
jgi:hypothetical protein